MPLKTSRIPTYPWPILGILIAAAAGAQASPPAAETHRQLCHEVQTVTMDTLLPYLQGRWADADHFHLQRGGEALVLNASTGERRAAPAGSAGAPPSPELAPRPLREGLFAGFQVLEVPSSDGAWLATEKDHDLWLRPATAEGPMRRLTTGGTGAHRWSLLDDMLMAGARWSPDGRFLAAIREDRSRVFELPLVRYLGESEAVDFLPLPRPGTPMTRTQLFLVPTGERDAPVEPLQLADGGKEHYLGILTWLPDSSELLFFKLRRDFKSFTLLAAKPTGTTVEVRELFTEWQRSFIKGIATNPGILSLLTPLPERRQFLWISERDGWDHLYLYDLDTGQPLRRLTAGQWPVLQVVAVDEEEGWVYFTAHPARGAGHPYDTHVHRVALDRRNAAGYPQTDRLTEGGGVHQPLFAPGARHFLDLHSAPDQPPTVTLRRSDGTAVATVETADASPLQAAGWRPPEPVTVTAADRHTELHGLLYRPFQPQAEPLPLIDAVYGGPQTLRTRWDFVGDPDACALAQSGFAVLLLDGRGTPERGKHFQDHVYGRLGQFEMDDHAAALRQLGEREDLDGERVGIYGGSWGGYFTFRALLTHPDLFDVGVAINGVAEVTGVAAMGVEPYLGGPPRKAREAYAAASNLPHAGALQGRLLVIHSTRDSNAPIGSVMKLLDAFNRAEKRYDLLLFPDEHHHVNPALRPYLQRRLREYFEEHL